MLEGKSEERKTEVDCRRGREWGKRERFRGVGWGIGMIEIVRKMNYCDINMGSNEKEVLVGGKLRG